MTRAAVSGGMASRICTEVQSIVQTKNGILPIVMPGARMPRIVAMKLIAAVSDADAADHQTQRPEIGGGAARKRAFRRAERRRTSRSPARRRWRKLKYTSKPPNSVIQKPKALSRGKAMSRAPIISGTR